MEDVPEVSHGDRIGETFHLVVEEVHIIGGVEEQISCLDSGREMISL